MNWKLSGKYAIVCGEWSISKSFVDGCTMYALWKKGEPRARKYDDDVEILKELAEVLGDG